MQRNLFNLPCVKTYNKSSNNYIPLETVEMFLGRTFFPRVNNIYTNFIEAIASRNYKYLHSII